MKIIDIQEKIVPISSEVKNAYISFAKMDCSVVAIKTDVKIDGENVVGYGFHSVELQILAQAQRIINRRVYITAGDSITHPKKFKIAFRIANNVLRFPGNQCLQI